MKKQRLSEKNVALGRRIKRYREKAGLSQEQLADKSNLTQTHISLLENGKRGISMATLQKVAINLGIKAHELLPF